MVKFRKRKDGVLVRKTSTHESKLSISVRLPISIYRIVMSYEGNNFTDKLINLIFDYNEFYNCNTNSDQEM